MENVPQAFSKQSVPHTEQWLTFSPLTLEAILVEELVLYSLTPTLSTGPGMSVLQNLLTEHSIIAKAH